MVLSFLWAVAALRPALVLVPIILSVASLAMAAFAPPPRDSNDRAVSNLGTLNTAEVTYKSSEGGSFGTIADMIAAGLIDDTFDTSVRAKACYLYSMDFDPATGQDYTIYAKPASTNTGRFAYYSTPDAVVRYSTDSTLAPSGLAGRSVQ
jgi:hypothetical protein